MGGVIHPLHQVDLLTPAERKITEKEYWAQRRGQEKLDELNQKMKEDGITRDCEKKSVNKILL